MLRAELKKQKQTPATVDKQLDNCADAVANGGVDILGEALIRGATELHEQRRRLLLEQEQNRQALTAADAAVMEEDKILKNLERFGDILQQLPPAEQKQLVQNFVERIDIRRVTDPVRGKAKGA